MGESGGSEKRRVLPPRVLFSCADIMAPRCPDRRRSTEDRWCAVQIGLNCYDEFGVRAEMFPGCAGARVLHEECSVFGVPQGVGALLAIWREQSGATSVGCGGGVVCGEGSGWAVRGCSDAVMVGLAKRCKKSWIFGVERFQEGTGGYAGTRKRANGMTSAGGVAAEAVGEDCGVWERREAMREL